MPHPRSLVYQLHKHWDIVETMARISHDLPALDPHSLGQLIDKCGVPESEHDAALRALISADILQPQARSDNLQLNPLVLDFVRGLNHEHQLGLATVLIARVEAVRTATEELLCGLESGDQDLLRQAARQLAEQFRQITQQLHRDRHAIQELAEQAKSADSAMPLARRYRRVLHAYEQYIEPMNQMMDSSASGTFYTHLEKAEQALDRVREQMTIQGALYTHRLQIRQVAWQAKELRSFGRSTAKHCADILLPLREEMRAENTLSSSISWLLGAVRKRGLSRALKHPKQSSHTPLWLSNRAQRVSVGDEVRGIMAKARNYHPDPCNFPAELEVSFTLEEWVDEPRLYDHLKSALPVAHLLEWLRQHYPHLPDAVSLRLYHDLVRSDLWQSQQASTESMTPLQTVRVQHYPHEIFPR
jgi:hypothetical protein